MSSPEDYMITCLNKKLFGFECLGCGGQRAVSFLLHGEFVAAFKMYPAIFTLIPLFIVIFISIFFKFKYSTKIINTLAIISIITIIVSFIIKLINQN